jgi:hypothetical protein
MLYRWSKQEERLGWGMEHVWGESRGAYMVLVRRPEGNRPLGNPDVNGRII